jgi:5'(3')-deoxyribonucleotidase
VTRYTVAVDFDGVLHSYTSPWVNAETIPDPPVPGAIEWLREIAAKFAVVIFTTRGRTTEGQRAVRHWLHENGWDAGMNATVTAEKLAALVYIDDRAWRFEGRFPTAQEIHAARPWNKPPASREEE